jgi:hypothetical protein
MNTRIKELAEQAWDHLIDEMGDVISEDGSLNSDFLHAYVQRFAELIVRECGKYLESEAERLYALSAQESNPNFQSNFEICAEKCYDNIQGLKEHFGVER